MTNKVTEDFYRRNIDLHTPKVVEVLPDYFKEDYPKLIQLLDAYHDFMDSDGGIVDEMKQVLRVRDVEGIALKFLEYILDEIGLGISGDQFVDPRVAVKFFPDFYRHKGTLYSAKAFFRMLYGEEVDIVYPKDNLFIVGESQIGAESLRYIQDGALYQILSVLVKSSKPLSQWKDLYKKLVHPAGFYLGGEVLIEETATISFDTMPAAGIDSNANLVSIIGEASFNMEAPYDPMTGYHLIPGEPFEHHILLGKKISPFAAESGGIIDGQFVNLEGMITPNVIGFSNNNTIGADFSATFETFDKSVHDSVGTNV